MDNLKPEDNESLFHVVFYENPQPMWFFDISTLKFLEINNSAIAHYGYSREEFLNMTIGDIRPPEDLEHLTDTIKRLSGAATSKRKFRHVLKDGTINHVQIVSYAVTYKQRSARLVIVNDITDSELYIERFELITKATHDVIWDWNLLTNELWLNDTFFSSFGYARKKGGETAGTWLLRIHPEDRERVVSGIMNAIQFNRKNWSDEYRLMRADGTYAIVLDRAYTQFREGKAIRMLGSMMDKTLQVQLQREREETESLLQELTAASPTALWMSDADCNLVYVNQTWMEWSGATMSKSLYEEWMNIVHEEDYVKVRRNYKEAHQDQSVYHVDYRIYFPDGSIRWITSTANPRYNSKGEFVGMIGSCTDITRQKHLEQQKDGFISTVSHELKTPITSVKGYAQLLSRSNTVKDLQGQNFLNRMRVQINRLDVLVQDLLDISRIESGKLTFNETHFEVNVLLAELINDLQLVFPSHRLIVTENQSCKIFADRNRVIQLITNLVDNAVKYSPNANKVYIRMVCNQDNLTLSIQDFGRGIPKDQEPFIFERYYQVNDVYKAPGLGIGLYICKEIVKRQSGSIWFKSVLGEGTTFYFKIPREQDAIHQNYIEEHAGTAMLEVRNINEKA